MKKTIYKYFFHEFIRYFSITIFALAVIVWSVQSVNYLDLVTEDGHAFATYFNYSLLTLSKIFTKLIPFSFFVATILTIVKFEKDNELIIIWSSGLNKIYIVNKTNSDELKNGIEWLSQSTEKIANVDGLGPKAVSSLKKFSKFGLSSLPT